VRVCARVYHEEVCEVHPEGAVIDARPLQTRAQQTVPFGAGIAPLPCKIIVVRRVINTLRVMRALTGNEGFGGYRLGELRGL
jgi:hypothetical protein